MLMTVAPNVPETSKDPPQVPAAALDTTAGSALHLVLKLLDRIGVGGYAAAVLYVVAVAATYLPLLIVAWLGPLPMAVAQAPHRLAFLEDASVMFTFLVSFPCMLILTVTDQRILTRSLNSVRADRTITISDADQAALDKRWNRLFRTTNLAAQALGLLVGGAVAYLNYSTFVPAVVGHWIADGGRLLLPLGAVYLYCIFLFYAVAAVYVVRNFAISFLLRDIVAHAQLHMLPLHPDKAGGLQPVGRLGLRNQYALTLFGLNVVVLIVTYQILERTPLLMALIVAAVISYLVLGPLVFMAPLLPFRSGMLRNKAQLMGRVALRLRLELDQLHARLPSGAITADDEALIERLRKIGALINELPVWPFDSATLRKFLTAYVLPIAGSLSWSAAKSVLGYFQITIPFLS
jgi:hypothetical protein